MADPISYKTETRIDGRGQPYEVRIPQYAPESTVAPTATPNVVAKTPLQLLQEREAAQNNGANPTATTTVPTSNYYSPDDIALQKALESKTSLDQTQSNTNVLSEEDYRAQALTAMQAEIDAQNKIYADKISRANVEGTGRLGSEGAIQARRGLLGSDFGAASTETVNQGNRDIVTSIEDERNARLAAIRSAARTEGTAKYEAATKAKKEGLDAYITDLQNRGTVNKSIAQKVAAKFLEQEVDPNKDSNYLEQVAKEAGVTSSSIISEYKTAFATQQAAKVKAEQEATKFKTDIEKTLSDITKNNAESENIGKKFEEDKRQFGLTYALDKQKVALEAQRVNIEQQKADQANPSYGASSTPNKALDQIDLVQGSLDRAKKLAGASGNTGILGKTGRFFTGTDNYTNLVAETNTLRTNVLTMMTDPTIKKFFGPQMSNADVQLMTSAGTTLNPELQDPAHMKVELERLQGLITRAKKAVAQGSGTVAPTSQIEYPKGSGKMFNVGAGGELTPAN